MVDVYDIAANIGKDFETIIDNYGPEAVTGLMPRVINILEHLETLAGKNQKEDAELTELTFAVQRLEADKANKAEERERYEKVSVLVVSAGVASYGYHCAAPAVLGPLGAVSAPTPRCQGPIA